jgi:hypothetical protein
MEVEIRLRKLEARYRAALDAVAGAKAHYQALLTERSATPLAVAQAKARWQELDVRKRTIAAQLGELEAFGDLDV